ncbi:MAG: cyclase family protein [Methanobrevibacter sp.]|jgi:kynurenine formamidase|nr:cyclase family protein [Candidatus Methanoflexus mossambicus]
MKYIDLTRKLKNNILEYPGDPKFKLKAINDKNSDYNLSKIETGLHIGTHIDAPYHYIENGKKINEIKLEKLIGKSTILNFKNKDKISKEINLEDLKIVSTNIKNSKNCKTNKNENLGEIAILKTGWSNNWKKENYFTENYYLSKDFANYLIENEINGICIDGPSVDKFENNKIHKLFLKNNIWIVENITNLNHLRKNSYFGYVIPLNIDAEASPVRVFLSKEK